MNARMLAPRYEAADFTSTLPAIAPRVALGAPRVVNGVPTQRRSPEEIEGLPGTKMSILVPVGELLTRVWGMETRDDVSYTYPGPDGSYSADAHVRVYPVGDDGVQRCTFFGDRVATDLHVSRGRDQYSTFTLIAHAFCGVDATLAAKLAAKICAHYLDTPEDMMDLLASKPSVETLTEAVRPALRVVTSDPYEGSDDFGEEPAVDEDIDAALAELTGPTKGRRALKITVDSVPDARVARHLTHLDWTQYGITERWCAYFGDLWKRHPTKGMMTWTGKVWEPADIYMVRRSVMAVIRATKQLESEFYEVDEENNRKEACRRFAAGFENTSQVKQIAEAILSLPSVATKIEDWDRDDLLINAQDGYLDARVIDGPLMPHDPALMMTMIAAASGNPDAKSKDLDTVLDNLNKTDPSISGLIQRCGGVGMLGIVVDAFVDLWGQAGTGKSSYWESLGLALGGSADTSYSGIVLIEHLARSRNDAGDKPRPALNSLQGKRFLYLDEATDVPLNTSLLKTFSGGGRLRTRDLNQAGGSWPVKFLFVCSGNSQLNLPDDDSGIWRRFVPIEVGAASVIAEENLDGSIRDRLLHTQEGIDATFAFALAGARAVVSAPVSGIKALQIPKAITAGTAAYRAQMNPLNRWLDDCIDKAPTAYSADAPTTQELSLSFSRWAKKMQFPTQSVNEIITKLAGRLATAGYPASNRSVRTRANGDKPRGAFHDGLRIAGRSRSEVYEEFIEGATVTGEPEADVPEFLSSDSQF